MPARSILTCSFAAVVVLAAALVAADRPAGEWALTPLKRPTVPAVPAEDRTWVRNPVDAFVLDKLLANGLSPSPQADRRTLIRRLTVDLTGLLPTPEDIAAFENDPSPNAYENLVDRLLSSPRYGERWARHWLDVVHYAESHGNDEDGPRPNAWPYRDYLIRSFNEDKSYARFVREQIAGDVLYPDDPAAIVATRLPGRRPVGPERPLPASARTRRTGSSPTTSTATTWSRPPSRPSLGLTVGCARCHDHKFDPITQEDYYALQAIILRRHTAPERHVAAAQRLRVFPVIERRVFVPPLPAFTFHWRVL